MKLAYVYFTYLKDQEFLELSLDNLDFLRKYNDIDVYVIDDSLNLMKDIPKNVNYQVSTFNRNKNLNSVECLKGMVDIYADIFSKKDYDWVVKIDCDTIINTWKWLEEADPKKYVQAGTYNPYWGLFQNQFVISFGTAHAFSSFGIENIQKEFNENIDFWKDRHERFPEDVMSSRMACHNDNENLNFYITNYVNNPIIDNSEIGLYQDYVFPNSMHSKENIPLEFLTNYSSITFKPTEDFSKNEDVRLSIRHKAKNRMFQYVNKKLNRLERYQ